MKDYIEVYTEEGKKEIMEAVCTFKLKNYKSNYIIYSELDKSHYYLAKYDKVNLTDLNTDFNDDEFEKAFQIFKDVIKE